MSNSPQADSVDSGPRPGLPTAMIHKKILDAARNDPGASLTEIANLVSGASVELVERVLENYGDPAERLVDATADRRADDDPSDAASADADRADATDPPEASVTDSAEDGATAEERSTDASADGRTDGPAVADLTETQLETLAAIAEHPQATQRELADVLGVSCATVNRRVSAVEGLSWGERESFVDSLFEGRDLPTPSAIGDDANGAEAEREASRPDGECQSARPLEDPELVRKVLHACLESDRISADEELEIIGAFVGDA